MLAQYCHVLDAYGVAMQFNMSALTWPTTFVAFGSILPCSLLVVSIFCNRASNAPYVVALYCFISVLLAEPRRLLLVPCCKMEAYAWSVPVPSSPLVWVVLCVSKCMPSKSLGPPGLLLCWWLPLTVLPTRFINWHCIIQVWLPCLSNPGLRFLVKRNKSSG